ncbi:MAG: hypothetical protein R3B47_11765 [Bacteroidia bacterium]
MTKSQTIVWWTSTGLGTGLAEIVTEPDFRTAEEAAAFLAGKIRRLVRYLEWATVIWKREIWYVTQISLSGKARRLRQPFSFLESAINYEAERQQKLLFNGETVIQETRNFDPDSGKTSGMRGKEDAEDYRYFPEPDLPPLFISKEKTEAIRATMPELPWERRKRYLALGVDDQQIISLVEKQDWGQLFDALLEAEMSPKAASNWLFGPIAVWAKTMEGEVGEFPLKAEKIAGMDALVQAGKMDSQQARGSLFEALLKTPEASVEAMMTTLGLGLSQDEGMMKEAVFALEKSHPDEVARFRAGERKLQGFLMGQLMRSLRGKADPGKLNQLIQQLLDN